MTKGPSSLIAAEDVAGTDVFGLDGDRVGTIDRIMIDKQSGKVAYAVMTFGGMLGIGGAERPVPWSTLSFDVEKNGFRTDITEDQLRDAPVAEGTWHANREWEERTHTAFAAVPYWI